MKHRKMKFLMLSVLVLSMVLSGCGKDKNGKAVPEAAGNTGVDDSNPIVGSSSDSSAEAKIPLGLENPEEVNAAGLLQDLLAGTAVQLNAGSLLGSGVIFSLDEQEMVIVTAAHVVEDAQEVSIRFSDGSYAESTDIRKSDVADAAFICLPAEKMESQEACAVTMDKGAFDALKIDDSIVVMGSADGTGSNAYEGNVLETWIYMEDFEQYMILARTYAFPGMSGGGIFNLQGYFMGILCGGNEENEIAVLPLSIILSEYEKYCI